MNTESWIPVETRLPDAGQEVLVVFSSKDRHGQVLQMRRIARYEPDFRPGEYPEGYWTTSQSYKQLRKMFRVTHWMPLPELPKEAV